MFLVDVPTIHANPLTHSHSLPEGINQLTCKLFLHCWPTVVVGVRLKIKRMGNGSAHSNTVYVQERVIMKPAYTHTIIQLTDFYYLVNNYNYILIDNKIYKNMAATSSVVKYTMKIQNLLHAVVEFTIVCPPPQHTQSANFNILWYSN